MFDPINIYVTQQLENKSGTPFPWLNIWQSLQLNNIIISKVTPIAHNRDPEYLLLPEELNPVWQNR
jgi:hypothetical protein